MVALVDAVIESDVDIVELSLLDSVVETVEVILEVRDIDTLVLALLDPVVLTLELAVVD